ncbi:hypothetical protein BH10BAC5_BH10BAC5_14710 [soil metagenome]
MNVAKLLFSIVIFFGLISSANSQAVYTQQVSGVTTSLNSVSAINDFDAWICGNGGVVLRTTNSGVLWSQVTSPAPTVSLYNIYGLEQGTAVVTGSTSSGTFVYRTTTSGSAWQTVFSQPQGFIDGIWFTDINNGFMYGDPVGGRWSLWRTTNGGATWDSTGLKVTPQNGSEAGYNNGLFVSGNNIWFGTNNTRIYYSSNNGVTWTAQTTTGQANSYTVWFNSVTRGLTGGSQLLQTSNSGTNWNSIVSPGSGNISGITGLGSKFWMTRQGPSIYYTADDGSVWSTPYTLTGATYNHLQIARTTGSSSGTLWAVTSTGQITRFGLSTGITPVNGNVATEYKLSQNYPNPFNPETKISFAIPHNGFTSLKIYSMDGKEVASLLNEDLSVGNYQITFNGAAISSGIYFYELRSGNFLETKKMMLVK